MIASPTRPLLARTDEPVTAEELVIGCVAEDDPGYLGQALRLVQSIRWLGGELARAEILVCIVGGGDRAARRRLESYGAEVRAVAPFDLRNRFANKLQLFAEAEATGRGLFLLLDCDTVVVRDPLPLLRRDVVQAKIAPLPTVTPEVFARVFRRFGLPLPPASHVNEFTGTPSIPYCNSGVVLVPRELGRDLVPLWRSFNSRLAAEPSLLRPCEQHCNQAALTLALAASGVPFAEAPVELNYQLNMIAREPPQSYLCVDPAILHYHRRVDDEGCLLPAPYPLAQARIDAFNLRRSRERDGSAPAPPRAVEPRRQEEGAQVVVLGMHRSGTSALTRVLNLMGCWAGDEEVFNRADEANPTGYWERRDVWALDEAILCALGATWREPLDLDLGKLGEPARARVRDLIAGIVSELGRRGAWVIKDPRLSLLFPLWREALERPVCLLVHRGALAVARSLETRDGMPPLYGIALWELYNRMALAATVGVPRLLVAYRDLIREPEATVERLHRDLGRLAGPAAGRLQVPSERALREFLSPFLDHHRPEPELERGYLNLPQLELLHALEDGSALDLDPVPPLSPGARELLASPVLAEREAWRSLQANDFYHVDRWITRLDDLITAFLDSRSWKLGFALTDACRKLLRRKPELTAADRRRDLMDEIDAWRDERM